MNNMELNKIEILLSESQLKRTTTLDLDVQSFSVYTLILVVEQIMSSSNMIDYLCDWVASDAVCFVL